MKVAYICNGGENTGWGEASRQYLRAIDSVNIDVCILPIRYSNGPWELPESLKHLEEKDKLGCDVIIQHCLPSNMEKVYGYVNVGLFASESHHLPPLWVDRLRQMDQIWVINSLQKKVCESYSQLHGKVIRCIPHAVDIGKFTKDISKLPIKELEDKFTFYFVGECIRRKNLAALLKAFHSEFRPHEHVELLIKGSYPGSSQEESQNKIVEFCAEIRKGLRLFGNLRYYKPEVIIAQRLSEEHLLSLHKTCNCLVIPSRGEAFSLPILDSLGAGNLVITTQGIGTNDIIHAGNGFLVDSTTESCFGFNDAPEGLHTGLENIQEISVNDLRRKMRQAFEQFGTDKDREMRKEAQNTVEKYSYEKIGNMIKEALNES